MKKIIVNTDGCIGCGACVALDPEHFDFNDEGLSICINQENKNSDELINAIESCPVAVISLEEASENDDRESDVNDGTSKCCSTDECSDCNCDCNKAA